MFLCIPGAPCGVARIPGAQTPRGAQRVDGDVESDLGYFLFSEDEAFVGHLEECKLFRELVLFG